MFEAYLSKPCSVLAVQFTDENKNRVFNELNGNCSAYADFDTDGSPILKITTIHGDMAIVRIGDWIVKDKQIGTYYPIKDDIFSDKYIKRE